MRLKRALVVLSVTILMLSGGFCSLAYFFAGPAESIPQIIEVENSNIELGSPVKKDLLRVMTLNLAHGRGSSSFRFIVTKQQAQKNLEMIATLVENAAPDVVALQEADESTLISGSFNHVKHMVTILNSRNAIVGKHVEGPWFAYGTGLISSFPLHTPYSITFDPAPPTLTKGFLVSTISWPAPSSKKVDIVSVHFDFLRKSSRVSQAEVLIDFMSQRSNSLVIMGDFNSGWDDEGSIVKMLARKLNLKAYEPLSDHTPTYSVFKKRIDWILISSDLKFVHYQVLPQQVSDHLAVVADIQPAE